MTNLPSLYKTLDGDSSAPATNLPSIKQLAPAARALHIFPEFLFPPSEINGILYSLQIGATSNNALNYGTPAPATILVIQIAPLPIPHLIPSAPAFIKLRAPSPEAILPATTSVLGNYSLSLWTVSTAIKLCPLAISMTKTSHPTSIRAFALSK